jgi:hypothetical protein
MPIIPQAWSNLYNQTQGGVNTTGFNPVQQAGANYYLDQLNGGGQSGIDQNLDRIRAQYGGVANQYGAFTQPNLTTAAQVQNPGTTADFMGAYNNPYQQDVINTTMNAAARAGDIAQSQLKNQYADSFGNSRLGVAQGELGAQNANNMAVLAAQLNNQGFNTAAGLGAGDAQQAQARALQNAANQQQTGQFNVNAPLAALGGIGQNLGQQTSTLLSQDADKQAIASGALAAGGSGFSQLLDLLKLGTGTFGQQTNQSGTTNIQQASTPSPLSLFGPALMSLMGF